MPKEEIDKLGEALLKALHEANELTLEDAEINAEELIIDLIPFVQAAVGVPTQLPPSLGVSVPPVLKYIESSFQAPKLELTGKINEVRYGGSKTRKKVVIGGETTLPFYRFMAAAPHRPAVTFDIFDMPQHLPKPIKVNFEEVMEDAGEWAKRAVQRFGADAVTIHLVSTDPYIKDTSVEQSAKTVERVLQAVDVPVLVGGSGNKEKDPAVLEKAAEVAHGERVSLNSAALDLDYKRIARAAKKYDQIVLSWTQLDMNNQKKLNTLLLDEGLPQNQIVMDPTCAALGYGLEYSFSIYERLRIAALKGDTVLANPMSAGATNAWGAREAWMSEKKVPAWGPSELRGTLWEALTSLTLCLAGGNIFMMLHPNSVRMFKTMIDYLTAEPKALASSVENWIAMKS
ncbi:MAG: CO dehydrogenase/acetyl-CoA synthase subunit delta [Promethearchaeati archaeon SRVP18_Atabeyarchaeia-1]